jgi:putative SOS response-associated peptidase YedK
MCGRYAIAIALAEAAEELDAELADPDPGPHYNLAPTMAAPIVVELPKLGVRRLGLARFGLVPKDSESVKDAGVRFINLRSEGIASQKRFTQLGEARRCLVVASGFFEWKPEGAKKTPFYFHPRAGRLLTFAGLWDTFGEGDGRVVSFSILTTGADERMHGVHERMPVIVPEPWRATWLNVETGDYQARLREVTSAPRVELDCYEVDRKVGNVRNDDPSVLEPAAGDQSSGGAAGRDAPA